jgi:hypothetical protein
MNLAYPTALFLAALAIPIVVFYILKIRLRRVPVSTIIFWRQIFEEKQARSLWQHLRHLISLLLQLLLLFLLVFALAEPFFTWEVLEARRLVLVIDNSASMNADDLKPSRLEQARAEGQRILSGLRFRDEVAIVAAGTQPQVLCGLTGHLRTLQDTLTAVTPSDGPTRVLDAVELARRLLVDQKNGKVLVLTDGCFNDAEKLLEAADVQLIPFGAQTGNVGITRFQARRSLVDPLGYEILVEVMNQGPDPVECRFELDLDGQLIDVVPLKLAANSPWSQVFNKTSAEGGKLTARLLHSDALAVDNQAVALLPRREVQPVYLVTDGNLFLEKVFEANPLAKLTVTKELPKDVPGNAVVVFHRKVPEKLPGGNVFVIDPAGSCDLWQVGEALQNPIVTKQDKDSPLMLHVRLDNVLMPEARKLTLLGDVGEPKILVGAVTGEPLYAAYQRAEGKVLVLTVNLDKGDLPLRTAFPIMTMNALAWFAGNQGELREALATGATSEIELPPSAAGLPLQLWPPQSSPRSLPAGASRFTIGPLDRCGIWRIAPSLEGKPNETGPAVLEIACNLANPRETDLRPAEALEGAASVEAAGSMWSSRPIWFYLLMAAFLLGVVEWFLYQRRWIS